MGRGIAFPSVTRRQLEELPLPLPPLAEQHRIVDKLDEIMTLCDEIQSKRTTRENARDRFSAAALARVNAPDDDPAIFAEHARFAIQSLNVLTARPDQLRQLRESILNLAVRGKLVAQDSNDEPASELIKQIAVERPRASKREMGVVDPPFQVPSNWTWTRLGFIGDWGSGSTPLRGVAGLYGEGITWLKSGELNDNQHLTGSKECITELALNTGSFRRNRAGDVLIAMYGATIGKLAILAEDAVTNQAVCGCSPYLGVFNRFLYLFLLSQRTQLRSLSEGGGATKHI